MAEVELTERTVLQAVLANRTPFGAIIDRLGKGKRPLIRSIDKRHVRDILKSLIEKGLIETKLDFGETLYKKVPHAMQKLQENDDQK